MPVMAAADLMQPAFGMSPVLGSSSGPSALTGRKCKVMSCSGKAGANTSKAPGSNLPDASVLEGCPALCSIASTGLQRALRPGHMSGCSVAGPANFTMLGTSAVWVLILGSTVASHRANLGQMPCLLSSG